MKKNIYDNLLSWLLFVTQCIHGAIIIIVVFKTCIRTHVSDRLNVVFSFFSFLNVACNRVVFHLIWMFCKSNSIFIGKRTDIGILLYNTNMSWTRACPIYSTIWQTINSKLYNRRRPYTPMTYGWYNRIDRDEVNTIWCVESGIHAKQICEYFYCVDSSNHVLFFCVKYV